MIQISLFFELLRSQPRALFWFATLSQTLLWWLVPTLFYAGPPGELPATLAIGHEFQLASFLGPPLAFWLAEIAFRIAGAAGVYLLAQICVAVTYWAVFTLGRAIVGVHHAVIAVLLMVGIWVFALPSPDFGLPTVCMMLTALSVLHLWRALGEGKRVYWFVVALDVGLLMVTSIFGLIIAGLLALFVGVTERGRACLDTIEPWSGALVVVMMLFPYLIWIDMVGDVITPIIVHMHSAEAADTNLFRWAQLLIALLLTHAGLALLVILASGWRARTSSDVPVFIRKPLDPFARNFIYYVALAPAFASTLLAVLFDLDAPIGGVPALVTFSGLALVVALGDTINVHRQYMIGYTWAALMVTPAILVVAAIFGLPWVAGFDLKVSQQADTIGRFFSDSFQRRTGKPLAVVAGDPRLAEVVAFGSPARPSVYFDAMPEHSPWLTTEDVKRKGAVIVWPATETSGAPPAAIQARFPGLVPEVPRGFERFVQGVLPLERVGWGMIRPEATAEASAQR
jgi:4-amino-4-deoxy-L-arabinose transferase-like glycosyltransferase